jgi:hypothetical protein
VLDALGHVPHVAEHSKDNERNEEDHDNYQYGVDHIHTFRSHHGSVVAVINNLGPRLH